MDNEKDGAVVDKGASPVPSDSGSKEALEPLKRGRGRPPGSGGKAKPKPGNISPEQEKVNKALYSPKVWEPIAGLYFDFRALTSGDKVFDLDTNQRQTLGLSLSVMMQSLGILDPKYLAMVVFLTNFAGIALEKEAVYRATKKKEKKEKPANEK